MRKLLSCLILVVFLCFLDACSKRRTLMTDAELDQERAGTVAFGFCADAGIDGPCGGSIAQIIDGEQKVPIHNTCPPDCSIVTMQASPGETVTLRQHLASGGSVVIQRNSWTAPPATRSVTVLPVSNPNLPR